MKTLKCCKLNFMQWRLHPKYLLCLLFLVLNLWKMTHGFGAYSEALGYPIRPWLFALLPGSKMDFLLLMMPFILIICDAPFRSRQQQFVLQRVGKAAWIRGQLLFLFLACLIYALTIWVLSWLFLLPHLEWGKDWGAVIQTAAQLHEYSQYSNTNLTYEIIKGATPMEATLWVFFSMVGVCFLLSEIMVLCNLYLQKGIGVAVTSGFLLLAFMIRFNSLARRLLIWISPVSWMDRSLMGHVNQKLPSYEYAALMILGLCLLLGAVILLTIHKCNLETEKE